MDEFQGSFVSFINKPKVVIRPVPIVPESEVIDEVDEIELKSEVIGEVNAGAQDQEEDGEESIVETGMYEVVPEGDIEASEEQPEKLIETPEMIYNRLHSELELLAQACQDDFLYQITNEEYLSLASAECTSLNRLSKLIFTWCNKNLRIFRVCKECDFRAVHAREINRHILGNESCKSYYYALGTFDAPSNYMQCQGCNYSTNVRSNMNRHQATRGHTGIEMIGGGGAGTSSGSSVQQQQQPLQDEWFSPVEPVGQQSEVVQLPDEVGVVEPVPVPVQMQQVQEPLGQATQEIYTPTLDQIVADILQKNGDRLLNQEPAPTTSQGILQLQRDDDPGGHISNLQNRLEQQVENSDRHFIFRISDAEYAAVCEQRTRHMTTFRELVDIYCSKTLRLYRVCEGCGFASFMRRDMVDHFKTGSCALRFFHALGTCDDDDPNREIGEDEAEGLVGEVRADGKEAVASRNAVTEVTLEANQVASSEDLKIEVTLEADEDSLNDVEVTPEANEVSPNEDQITGVTLEVEAVATSTDHTTEVIAVTPEGKNKDLIPELTQEANGDAPAETTEITPTENEPSKRKAKNVKQKTLAENRYQCPLCNSEMAIKNKRLHFRRYCPGKFGSKKPCTHCEMLFDTWSEVKHHIRDEHNPNFQVPKDPKSMPPEKKPHKPWNRYQCPLCKRHMDKKNKFQHFQRHCPAKFGYKRPCHLCPLEFESYTAVRHHIKTEHFNSDPENLRCKECDRQFITLSGFKTHCRNGCSTISKKLKVQAKAAPKDKTKRFAVKTQCKDCLVFFLAKDLLRHQQNYCKKVPYAQEVQADAIVTSKEVTVPEVTPEAEEGVPNEDLKLEVTLEAVQIAWNDSREPEVTAGMEHVETNDAEITKVTLEMNVGEAEVNAAVDDAKVTDVTPEANFAATNANLITAVTAERTALNDAVTPETAEVTVSRMKRSQCKDCLVFFLAQDLLRHQQNNCKKVPFAQEVQEKAIVASKKAAKSASKSKAKRSALKTQCKDCLVFFLGKHLLRHQQKHCKKEVPNAQEEQAEAIVASKEVAVTEVTPEAKEIVPNEDLKLEVTLEPVEIAWNDSGEPEVTAGMEQVETNDAGITEVTLETNDGEAEVKAAVEDAKVTDVTPEANVAAINENLIMAVTAEKTATNDAVTPETAEVTVSRMKRSQCKYCLGYFLTLDLARHQQSYCKLIPHAVVRPEAKAVVSSDTVTAVTPSMEKVTVDLKMQVSLEASEIAFNDDKIPETNEMAAEVAPKVSLLKEELLKVTTNVTARGVKHNRLAKTKKFPKSKTRFTCPLCNSEMAWLNRYNHYKRYCPAKFGNKRPCYHCKRLFENWREVKRHIRDVHNPNFKVPKDLKPMPPKKEKKPPKPKPTENRFQCPLCNRDMDKRNKYQHYKRFCPGKFGNKRPCDHCPMFFDSVTEARRHMRAEHNHSDPEKLTCKNCGKQFRHLAGLKTHIRNDCSKAPKARAKKKLVRAKKQCKVAKIVASKEGAVTEVTPEAEETASSGELKMEVTPEVREIAWNDGSIPEVTAESIEDQTIKVEAEEVALSDAGITEVTPEAEETPEASEIAWNDGAIPEVAAESIEDQTIKVEAEEVALSDADITEVTTEAEETASNGELKMELTTEASEIAWNDGAIPEVTAESIEDQTIKVEAEEVALSDADITEVTSVTNVCEMKVKTEVEDPEVADVTPEASEVASSEDRIVEVTLETAQGACKNDLGDYLTQDYANPGVEEEEAERVVAPKEVVSPEVEEVASSDAVTQEVEQVVGHEDLKMEVALEASEIAWSDVDLPEVPPEANEWKMEVKVKEDEVKLNDADVTDVTPEADAVVSNEDEITNITPKMKEVQVASEATESSLNDAAITEVTPKPSNQYATRFTCPLCNSEMAWINRNNHNKRYCPAKFGNKKPCYHCKKLFDNWREVKRHIRDVHNPNYKVPKDPKPMPPRKEKKPPKPKPTENRFQCPLCNRDMDKKNKSQHYKRFCPAKFGNKRPCDHCPILFDSVTEVRRHMKAEHNYSNPENLRCKDCGKQFINLPGLKNHWRAGCPKIKGQAPRDPTLLNPVGGKTQCKDCLAYFMPSALARHQSNFCKKVPYEEQPGGSTQVAVQDGAVPVQGAVGQEAFQCKDCLGCCASREDLERHRKDGDCNKLESIIKVEETKLAGVSEQEIGESKT